MTAAVPGQAIVSLRGVSRTYEGGVHALTDASLELRASSSHAIVGPSGSGKSTLLNILGLLDSPTTGTYELLGRDVAAASDAERCALRREHLGFVFQAFHLLPSRSVVENVMLGNFYSGASRDALRAEAMDRLARTGLSARAGFSASTLSGGERQRVAIARALMGRPRVLLCDEPTGNLDSRNSASVLDLLLSLTDSGVTVVIVTHDQAVADNCAHTLRVLDGRVTQEVPFHG